MSNHGKHNPLDPLNVICKFAILSFCDIGSKTAIRNNIIKIHTPESSQSFIRWWYADGREDFPLIFRSFIRLIKWYLAKSSENAKFFKKLQAIEQPTNVKEEIKTNRIKPTLRILPSSDDNKESSIITSAKMLSGHPKLNSSFLEKGDTFPSEKHNKETKMLKIDETQTTKKVEGNVKKEETKVVKDKTEDLSKKEEKNEIKKEDEKEPNEEITKETKKFLELYRNKHIISIIEFACIGLEKQQITYDDGNIILATQLAANCLRQAVETGELDENIIPVKYRTINDKTNNLINVDKIMEIWDVRTLSKINELLCRCQESLDDAMKGDIDPASARNTMNGYMNSIKSILMVLDEKFKKLIEQTYER
jgi:hypothetical protein